MWSERLVNQIHHDGAEGAMTVSVVIVEYRIAVQEGRCVFGAAERSQCNAWCVRCVTALTRCGGVKDGG
jgi:hypothetical protein